LADWSHTTPGELTAAHCARPNKNTNRAYRNDLSAFTRWAAMANHVDAVRYLCELSRGAARRTIDQYIAYMHRQTRSLYTIRRRVGSLLGLLRLAHDYDVVPWSIRVRLPTPEPIRNTRGPGRPIVLKMLQHSRQRQDAKGIRDTAILCLLYYSALRSQELLSLDVGHVDQDLGEIAIIGKGTWTRTRLPIPRCTSLALGRWIEIRGSDDGPLFTSLHHARVGRRDRLTYNGLYSTIRSLGRRAGRPCSPHGIRHSAATDMERLTNGNVLWGMALTRHKDPRTLLIYNDQRLSRARQASEILVAGHPLYAAGARNMDT